jgi:hypothetical protein
MTAAKKGIRRSKMLSAADQVLQAIDALLVEQDDKLVLPMTTLNSATSTIFQKNQKVITALQNKVLKAADLATTQSLDALDSVYTTLLQGLDTWQYDSNFLLTQLAAKGGFTEAGEPLHAALQKELAEAPQLAYGGTLVLAIAEAVPYLDQLIEVLREIRDRMPPQAMRVFGTQPAKSAQEDEPIVDTEEEAFQLEDEPPID